MFDDVVQAFLNDAERCIFNRRREAAGGACHLQLDDRAVATMQRAQVLFQRRDEPLFLKRHGAELEDQRAHLGQCARRQLVSPLEPFARFGRIPIKQAQRRFGEQRDAEQALGDRIVQVPRKPITLLDHGVFTRLFVQPRVFDRRRGLIGEERRELGVALGEAARPLTRLHRYRQDRARIAQNQALLVAARVVLGVVAALRAIGAQRFGRK